jgi:hypothetical protein
LLERFLKELAKFDFLTDSKEFHIFAREKGEIDKILTTLMKQTPLEVLEKFRINFKVNEDVDYNQMNEYRGAISSLQSFLKKAVSVMEVLIHFYLITVDSKTSDENDDQQEGGPR